MADALMAPSCCDGAMRGQSWIFGQFVSLYIMQVDWTDTVVGMIVSWP
jgi:hypothetical protein